MPASPKRQPMKSVQGLLSAPPQARPPQTGGPVYGQPQTGGPAMGQQLGQGMAPTARQEQRQQYLATHPNARGNQPQTQGQAIGQAMGQPSQRPQQQMPDRYNQALQQSGQMPQNGFQPMPRPIQGNGFGASLQNMIYRYPQGQQPNFPQMGQQLSQGIAAGEIDPSQQGQMDAMAQARGNAMAQQQNPGQWQNQQMNNMNWYKGNGGY